MDDHAQAALQAPRPLTPEQMSAFIERGYLVLRGCIPAEPMRRLVDDTLRHKRPMPAYRGRGERAGGPPIEALDLTDPTTWGSPSLYLDTRRSMALADAPILWGALASLVGGEDRLASRSFGQSLILNADHRPPPCPPLTPAYCRDLHWHIDVTSPRTTLFDRRDALVLLVLWSKVEPGGGGTLVCPDSLTRVVHQLEDTKGGVDTTDQRWGGKIIEECADIFEFTGDVGDVLIAHPFTLHASHYNYSRALRAVENPTIMVRRALDYADNPRPSPVESAVLRRRRRTAVKPRRPDPGAGDIAALTSPAARAESSLYRRLQHFLPVPAKPPWLSLVNDQVPLHMRARRVRGILRLWMVTADGIQRVVDVEATSAGIRRRVAKRGSPWIRSDPQLAGRWGPHLVAFSERVAWAQRAVRGEDIATKHRPSTREAALASLARSLRERSEPSASALATAEGALPWLRAYLAIARAEWSTLRSLSDEARGALPSWLETLVLAVSGDVRGLASWTHADPAEGAHTDSLSVLEGLALAEIQWVDRAYERMLAGLRHLAPYERAHFYVPLAKLAAARGDEDEAAHYLLAALQCRADDERLLTRISGELLRLGDFTRAAELLRARADREPQSPAVFETLAALASWCGQVDEARAWAERALRDEPPGSEPAAYSRSATRSPATTSGRWSSSWPSTHPREATRRSRPGSPSSSCAEAIGRGLPPTSDTPRRRAGR